MHPCQVYTYFHVYMLTYIFFWCGVVQLNPDEEMELIKIYEGPIVEKFGLGEKFLCKVLYFHKNFLGMGFMRPNTILTILSMKLYFGYTRLRSNTNDLIEHSLQTYEVEAGRSIRYWEIFPTEKSWCTTWIDNIMHEFQKRNIVVEQDTGSIRKITTNKTIMDVAVEYTKYLQIIGYINQVRRYKKVLLPMELVGTRGKTKQGVST